MLKKILSPEVITMTIVTAVVVGGLMFWRDNRADGFKMKKSA